MTVTAFKQVDNNAKSHVAPNSWNNVTSPLTFSITNGEGAKFPLPGNGFYVTIYDDSTYTDPGDDPKMEIGICTARTGDSLTVARNQLGTSAVSHSGSPAVKLLIVDQQLIDIQAAINTLEGKMPTGSVLGDSDIQAVLNKDLSSPTNTFPINLLFALTVSGIQNIYNKKIHSPVVDGLYDNGTIMGIKDIDWNNGDVQKVTISGAATLRMLNAQVGQRLTLQITENATGGYAITLSGTGAVPFRYPGGSAPTYTTSANAVNLVVALYNGSVYLTQASVGFA